MWKDGQGWQSTEPRMTHLFAEERPLELGFEGQKVAGRPVENLENAKTRMGEGNNLSGEPGSSCWEPILAVEDG